MERVLLPKFTGGVRVVGQTFYLQVTRIWYDVLEIIICMLITYSCQLIRLGS